MAGRKTREEKLEILKANLEKKIKQKAAIENEIKSIKAEISEIEHAILIKATSKLNATLSKKGLSIEELTEAVESGKINLDQLGNA